MPNEQRTNEIPTATDLVLDSVITCPYCAARTRARMPTNACQYFWDCPACGALLQPKAGDCCVFCSYGSVACPPMQSPGGCCARQADD